MADPFSSGNLVSYLEETAKSLPKQAALIEDDQNSLSSRTFEQLFSDVVRCAHYLKAKKISQGGKVLLFVTPGHELTVISFALIYLGAIPVIIDPGMGISSLLSSIRSTKPDALIGTPLVFLLSFGFRKAMKSVKVRIPVFSSRFGSRMALEDPRELSKAVTKPSDLAAIVFTSGSTGSPKGVRYLHGNFNAQVRSLRENFGIEPGEVDLATLPIFSLFNPAMGVTTVLPEMNPRKPALADGEKLVCAIERHGVTSAFSSPVIGKKIADFCASENRRLSKMKRIFLAGAPPPPSLVGRLSEILENGTVFVPYGATEALPVSFAADSEIKACEASILAGKGSLLGRKVKGVTIKVFPSPCKNPSVSISEQGELAQEEVGEICVSGEVVTDGYYRMPGASFDARFEYEDKRFHRMGDLGYFDRENRLRFLGRKAECVHTRHGPLETERCEPMINAIPEVRRSALIGLGKSNPQVPCMVLELENPKSNQRTKENLKVKIVNLLTRSFPEFGFKHVVFEEKIPVDARHNAKIHRLSLSKKWTVLLETDPEEVCPR